jgi:hypothetical protein
VSVAISLASRTALSCAYAANGIIFPSMNCINCSSMVFLAKDRTLAPNLAPPQGLFLWEVGY